MKQTNGRNRLRIVWNKDASVMPVTRNAYRKPVQMDLGLDASVKSMRFVDESCLSGDVLVSLLEKLKPNFVFDLRSCPRFDFVGYSRRRAFTDFHYFGACYVAPSADFGLGDLAQRARDLCEKVSVSHRELVGPILVLIDSEQSIDPIAHAMPKAKHGDWVVAIERVGRHLF